MPFKNREKSLKYQRNYYLAKKRKACPNCGKLIRKTSGLCCKCNQDKNKVYRFCNNCGIQLKYNTKKCQRCYSKSLRGNGNPMYGRSGENSPNWYGGSSFEPYTPEFNYQLKEQIRQRDNYTCQECGYTEEELGYKLRCHHINYNKKNNKPKNLISLCKSCHSKTNFNRDNWTNYFLDKFNNLLYEKETI